MKRILTIWAALGAIYVALEVVFRGHSHPAMLIVGGLCGVLVGAINQAPRFYNAPVIVQAVIGAVIVLAVEFVAGCVLNRLAGAGGMGLQQSARQRAGADLPGVRPVMVLDYAPCDMGGGHRPLADLGV